MNVSRMCLGVLWCWAIVAAAPGVPRSVRAADSVVAKSFTVAIDSELTMLVDGQEQKIKADTILNYTRKRSARKVEIWFDEVMVKTSNNGQELMDTTMNAEKVVNVDQGETREVLAADVPDELKQVLKDSFGAPLCKIELDAAGAEGKTTVVARPGAQSLIDNGLIASTRLFHVNFPLQQDEWQAEKEVSMGSGGYVKGKLSYTKVPGGEAGRTVVKVSGILSNDEFKPEGSPVIIKNARYRVTGEQTYDLAKKEWVAGSLVMETTFDLFAGEEVVGSASGTMHVDFKAVAKRKPMIGQNKKKDRE